MQTLEKLLFPIALVIALGAMLLVSAGPDTVVLVGRGLGITLVVLLVVGGVMRTRAKLRKGREQRRLLAAEAARTDGIAGGVENAEPDQGPA